MTEELKPCPFCGNPAHLVDDLITFYVQCDSCSATGAVSSYSKGAAAVWNTRALTQRPAAQTEREAFEAEMRCEETWGHRSLRKHVDGRYQNWVVDALWTVWQARASLPAHQQATPEPVPAEQAKWCEYVAGVVDCWVSAEWPHYNHMDEDRRVKAIAGIIERRLWALQKQAATPEPVGEVEDDEVFLPRRLAATQKLKQLGYRYNVGQGQWLPDTRPAPGVPEADPLQGAVDWFWQAIPNLKAHDVANRLSIGCNRAARLLAAAQAKGGGHG